MENIRDFFKSEYRPRCPIIHKWLSLALGNTGPACTGAVAYIDGYKSSPVSLKKDVSPVSNYYTEEFVGIQLGLTFSRN